VPIVIKERIKIIDIEYVKENDNLIVRIFIDKNGGIMISDCERMSYIFKNVLDRSNILKNSYILEISSPGLNRILKSEMDFKCYIGKKIRIQTNIIINNQKKFLGILLDFKNKKVKIDDLTSGVNEINFLDIKKANIMDI
jgi:ribosome maturation factor RimP